AGLSERHVAFMLERLSRRSRAPTTSAVEPWSSIIAAVPIDEHGRRHPLAAAVAVAGLRARAAEQLAAGRHRLQELFVGPDVVEVASAELPDPEVLAPCNTPQQWAELLTRLATRSSARAR
ncbi:MAG TPA: hypothetical protein VK034_28405, partial [Enhygromyxa sp.]|nr:hypothetical protein [Enhygromyxa sp.]